jgi:hypothetical protein
VGGIVIPSLSTCFSVSLCDNGAVMQGFSRKGGAGRFLFHCWGSCLFSVLAYLEGSFFLLLLELLVELLDGLG